MTHKKVRIAAYGMTAFIAASSVSMDAQAVKLSDVLPAAGIGVTFSDGVTLAQMQERVQAEENQDGTMMLSVSEMKAYLEENKLITAKTITSASIVKTVEVQQVLAALELEENEIQQAAEAEKDTVIAAVANAGSNEAVASAKVESMLEEQVPMSSSDDITSDTDGDSSSGETQGDTETTVSGNDAEAGIQEETENTDEEVLETTQSVAELVAGQAATLTDEEKEFSNLVIAQVNNYVNVRSDASEESEVVGKLYDKSVGTYLSEKDGWYEINSGNVTGYVKAEFCVTGTDAIELAKKVGTRIATVTTTTLKVREEASAESTVLGLVPIEEELSVVEEDNGWIKVDIEEGYGWVSMDYVSLSR